jgi:threonine aldolase
VLCGSTAFIERARAYRRMVGGAMRQAGVMAAAGIVALETMVDRLSDDHRRAKRIAEGVHAVDPRLTDPKTVETNIIMLEIGHSGIDAKAWIAALDKHGLKAGAWSRKSLRLVTHRHIDDAAVEKVPGIIRAVSAELVRRDVKVA